MSLSSKFEIKSCKPAITNVDIQLSRGNASATAEIILIKTEKDSLNLSKHLTIINCRPTLDTLQVGVHVARIAKDKHAFLHLLLYSH
jgi:hypothetical protein